MRRRFRRNRLRNRRAADPFVDACRVLDRGRLRSAMAALLSACSSRGWHRAAATIAVENQRQALLMTLGCATDQAFERGPRSLHSAGSQSSIAFPPARARYMCSGARVLESCRRSQLSIPFRCEGESSRAAASRPFRTARRNSIGPTRSRFRFSISPSNPETLTTMLCAALTEAV